MPTTITIYHGLEIYHDDAGQVRVEFADRPFSDTNQAKKWIDGQLAAGNLADGVPCPNCGGSGQIMDGAPGPNAFVFGDCRRCGGSGLIPDPDAGLLDDDDDDLEETDKLCPRCGAVLDQHKYTGNYHCSNIECRFESPDGTEF